MPADRRRYLVVFHLKDAAPQRLAVLIPKLTTELSRLSLTAPESAFRSATADLFGYSIVTELVPAQIKAAIESPGKGYPSDVEPILASGDNLMVLELGDQFLCGTGFTRFGTWLQRNPAKQA